MPPDLSLSQLKTILCPLIATNEEEQAVVYDIYDRCLERVRSTDKAFRKIYNKKTTTSFLSTRELIFLLGITALLLYFFSRAIKDNEPIIKTIEPTYFTIAPGRSKTVCIEEKKLRGKPQMTRALVYKRPPGFPTLGNFTLDNFCLTFNAKDSTGIDSVRVRYIDVKRQQWQTAFYLMVEAPRLDTIEQEVPQKRIAKRNKADFNIKRYPFLNDIRDIEVPPLSAWEEFYQKYAKWIKLLLAAILTLILGKILLNRDKKRKRLIAKLNHDLKTTPVWSLKPGAIEEILTGDTFVRILNNLRKRTPDDFYRLNIPKTVNKTVRNAGMIQFQYELQTRPAEYVLLIDNPSEANHLSQLYELLFEHFKQNEVYLERYFFDEKMLLCRNETNPKGIKLEELQHKYYASQLIILAASYRSEASFIKKLQGWKDLFNGWKSAAILLPAPIFDKVEKDVSLRENFTLIPATIHGLDTLITQFNEETVIKSNAFEEEKTINFKAAKSTTIPFLRQYFTPLITPWVAACAFYPTLHWNLTVHLGKFLAARDNLFLSIEQLFELVKIPWFIEGKIPDTVRVKLLKYLHGQHPKLYQDLKKEIAQLLQAHAQLGKEQIFDKHDTILGLEERFATFEYADPINYKNKRAEIPIISKLARKPKLEDFIIPKEWKKYLNKIGFPNLGMKGFWRDFLFIFPLWLLLMSFIYWLPEKWENCDGELVIYEHRGTPLTLCISKPEHRILYNEYLGRDAIQQQQEIIVDSLTKAVQKIVETDALNNTSANNTKLDSAKLAYFGNLGVEYFNRGVQFYNNLSQIKQISTDSSSLRILKEEACYHFNRAMLFDSLDADIQRAIAWCLKEEKPVEVSLQGYILNEQTLKPIPNTKVVYKNQFVVTNAEGWYSFDILPDTAMQTVNLDIQKMDFLSIQDSFKIISKDSLIYQIDTIHLLPADDLVEKYTIQGKIIDLATGNAPVSEISIFSEEGLESIASKGEFSFQTTIKLIRNNRVFIRFEGEGYQTLKKEVIFDEKSKEATLNIELEAILGNLLDSIDATADIGISDSVDYLLKRLLEIRESPSLRNFAIPLPKMSFIQGNTFAMGDVMDDQLGEELPHVVTLNSFYLGVYEVTFDEFDLFCKRQGLALSPDNGWGRGNKPVLKINWYQAIEYCNWLSEEHGYEKVYTIDKDVQDPNNLSESDSLKWSVTADWSANGYRLPTEAEWEFAARQGGEKVRFGNGKNRADPEEINFAGAESGEVFHSIEGTYRQQTVETGSFEPNSAGLYDMSGNVMEWCWDWLGPYPKHPETNSQGPSSGALRVLRGGGFNLPATHIRTSFRYGNAPNKGNNLGFRLCRSAK